MPSEDIEALADEAERGYDLDKAIKVTVGRPLPQPLGCLPARAGAGDPKLAKALQARARHEQRSVSEIARTALREYLERAA
jgi:hypothetical protein